MSKAEAWSTDDLTPLIPRVFDELAASNIHRNRPVIAVDVDEVIVHFAEHFGDYVAARGIDFHLVEYRLDSALSRDGAPLPREEIAPLIWAFIEEETHRQRPIPGAVEALARLQDLAQIVILTSAPSKVRNKRLANLADLGLTHPLVMNEGGKGRALTWLAERADAPVIFVDDSADQHRSAANHAAMVKRVHFVGSDLLRPIIGRVEHAHHHPQNWQEVEAVIRACLA